MALRAEHGVYVAVLTVVAAFLVLLYLLGPLGWLVGAFVLLGVIRLAELSGLFGEPSPEQKRNCHGCGAPNAVERTTCSYCDAPLSGSNEH